MPASRLLYFLLAALCLLRLLLIGAVEILPDEAYYTLWSRYLDISYYSKGPGIASVIWLGTHLFGYTEFGVRVFSPLLALGTSLLMFHFARRLYGESIAFWAVLTLQVIPIFQAGGLLMTIDPLSMFFWMAALFTFWRALEDERAGEDKPGFNYWWPATGALIGLGFLCKWTNAIQLLSVLLLLAITPRHRSQLWRAGVWSMLGVFVLFTIPPIVWNQQHDWITVAHLSARGGLQKTLELSISEFGKFLGAHFGVYSPLIFAAMLAALWIGGKRARTHYKPRFLLAFAVPLLALYFGLSLREAGEANWTAPAALSLLLLTVALVHEWAETDARLRVGAFAALVLGAAMSIFTIDSDLLRVVKIPWPYDADPSGRMRGWKSSAEIVETARADFEKETGKPVFLIANKYQTAAALSFYMENPRAELPGHPPVYIPESQAIENQFSFWPRYDQMEDLVQIARDYISNAAANPDHAASLSGILATLALAEKHEQPTAVADARRVLVQALQPALPHLPLDESFVEEQGLSLFAGRTALYITDRAEERPPSTIKDGFARVEMIACIDLHRRGQQLRQLRIFACYEYRGMPL